jgi:hypothetical protein
LQVGSFVEYINTGTKGNVTEIFSDDAGTWALIDKTNLYYKTEILRIIRKVTEKELGEKNTELLSVLCYKTVKLRNHLFYNVLS